MARLLSILLATGILMIGAFMLLPAPARADGGSPTTPTPAAARMADPTTWTQRPPDGPSQLEHGAFMYWLRCMVCHGDQGQGLAKFRPQYPKSDQNCSAHQCHNGPGSGAGFSFPDAPAVMGEGTLTRFKTAQELFTFVSTRMPYQAPGVLSQSDYWAVVSYLLQKHGVTVGNLDERNAASISLQTAQDNRPTLTAIALVIVAAAVALGFLLVRRFRFRQ